MMFWEQRKSRWVWVGVGVAAFVVVVLYGASRPIAAYLFQNGLTELTNGNYGKAEPFFNRSLWFDAKNPEAYFQLGLIALGPRRPNPEKPVAYIYDRPDYPKAIGNFQKAVTLSEQPQKPDIHSRALFFLAVSYANRGDFDTAERFYRQHIALYPNNSFVSRYFLARGYFNYMARPEEALQVLGPILESQNIRSDYLPAVYLLFARLYLYLGEHNKAVEFAQRAIAAGERLEPNTLRWAHLTLAHALAKGKNLMAALEAMGTADQLVRSESDKTENTCVFARVYFAAGNYQKALSTAKSVAATSSSVSGYPKSLCLYVTAQAYERENDLTRAKSFYQKYVEVADAIPAKDAFVWRNLAVARNKLAELPGSR